MFAERVKARDGRGRAAWWLLLAAALWGLGARGAVAEKTRLDNTVRIQVQVERAGALWPLARIPALRQGDTLHVRVPSAAALQRRFPFALNQRLASMKDDHGFLLLVALVSRATVSGFDESVFPEPKLSADRTELLFPVAQNDSTPFVFLVPAIYDGAFDRAKEWKHFVRLVLENPELKSYLLRQVNAAGMEALSRAVGAEDTDALLQKAQYLLPRVSVALKLRGDPQFVTRARQDQSSQLYSALGLQPPDHPAALDYVNSLLDAFASTDPNNPVKVPTEAQINGLLSSGLALLPAWYNSYLVGLNVFSKLAVVLVGANRRVRDEHFFVAALPKAAPDGGAYTLEPTESLQAENPGRRGRRKNVLVACFGRMPAVRALVRLTQGDTLYLSNESPNRQLTLDPRSPISPEQLDRFASNLRLYLPDGDPQGIPLTYDPKATAFRLPASGPLPARSAGAVIRGDWGHVERLELSERFTLAGVSRARWTLENPDRLVTGGADPLRLRADGAAVKPMRVIFRYRHGGDFEAKGIEEKGGGVFAVAFDLNGRRAGEGRLEIYKPGVETPDVLESSVDESGAPVPLQLYEAVGALRSDDLRYFAYDDRLQLRRAAFPESALPLRLMVGESVFERVGDSAAEWLAFVTAQPVGKAGAASALLHLADGRRISFGVRVRPRRPAFAVAEWRPRERVQIPWNLPENVVSHHTAVLLTLNAEPGYRFTRTARLLVGNATLMPDMEVTDPLGVSTLNFTLDPKAFPNLRGKLYARLREEKDGEAIQSDEVILPFTLLQLPEGALSARFRNGRYQLFGQRLDVFHLAGAADALQPVQPVVAGQNTYIEFAAAPGKPLRFVLRNGTIELPLDWTGPIAPAAPAGLAVEPTPSGAALRWERAAGATVYQVYRSVDPAAPLRPENRIAEVPDGPMPALADPGPLAPGEVYRYRVVAVCRRDGFPEDDFTAPGESVGALLVPPAVVQEVTAAFQGGETPAVEVKWKPAVGATAYRVYRGATPDFVPAAANLAGEAAGATLTLLDKTVPAVGQSVVYKVVAVCARPGFAEALSAPSAASAPVVRP